MNASRAFSEEKERRVPRNRQREREVQPSARRPATRTVWSDPVPVEKAVPVIRVHDTVRVIAVVDQWNPACGFGFIVSPELDCEVLYFHVRDCNFDESLMTLGVTVECTPTEGPSAAPGRTPRRAASRITLAEPVTHEIETIVARVDDRGNGWLKNDAGSAIYFRSNRTAIKEGDKVRALVYPAPRGPRAAGVTVIP